MQTAAQARMSHNRGGRQNSADLLIDQEVFRTLELEPSVELSYKISFRLGKGKLVNAPVVQSLQLAMRAYHRFKSAVSSRTPERQMEKEKAWALKEATHD